MRGKIPRIHLKMIKNHSTWLLLSPGIILFLILLVAPITNILDESLRLFEPGRIGPVDGDDHIGGNYASAISFNTDLPIFESWQEADIKYFYDAANVWGTDY